MACRRLRLAAMTGPDLVVEPRFTVRVIGQLAAPMRPSLAKRLIMHARSGPVRLLTDTEATDLIAALGLGDA